MVTAYVVPESSPAQPDVYAEAGDLYGDLPEIPSGSFDADDDPVAAPRAIAPSERGAGSSLPRADRRDHHGTQRETGTPKEAASSGAANKNRSPGSVGGRPFVSYVAVQREDTTTDPHGLDQGQRMKIEGLAIASILRLEPGLKKAPVGNAGYDLYESDSAGKGFRFIEVKAMTGSLDDRPATISRTQFAFAQKMGSAFWLYIVEHAGDPDRTRVLRINDPYALAGSFTFDRGWAAVAS